MAKLIVYYDNPSEPSDMYLKWLKRDCENKGIEYCVVENFDDFNKEFDNSYVLPMLPVEDERIIKFLMVVAWADIDNVAKTGLYTSATAQGIYNHIVEEHPNRETSVAVIGRGVVGKELLDLLINYGYTVYEFNSKSDTIEMYRICKEWADVIVGLATCEIFDDIQCNHINRLERGRLIDAGNCFNTTDKFRCGKWTREVLLNRVMEGEN